MGERIANENFYIAPYAPTKLLEQQINIERNGILLLNAQPGESSPPTGLSTDRFATPSKLHRIVYHLMQHRSDRMVLNFNSTIRLKEERESRLRPNASGPN